ncbi:MAG: phosphoribosylglycinamide formyltransferase [Chitinophagaceae bacterium]|nr:phosphoribosylglycinamide formyltransferase [Chitinophagaceae bacterium]
MPDKKIKLALFASGTGSNVARIVDYFRQSSRVECSLIVCNKQGAGVLQIAEKEGIDTVLLDKETFFRGDAYTGFLQEAGIDWIILAGFLWKIPPALIRAWPEHIINIHPALLPAYGGKGMYGRHVHEAVLQNGEKESGITIHLVDEQYDHGRTLFQARCPVEPGDTPETLAKRVQALEHTHFPRVIEELVS